MMAAAIAVTPVGERHENHAANTGRFAPVNWPPNVIMRCADVPGDDRRRARAELRCYHAAVCTCVANCRQRAVLVLRERDLLPGDAGTSSLPAR